ncbi:N-acetylneuraminate synthase family protein [Polynucleobacter sp. Adler-ghost]|uniref:N-acetylneuraminate synthase family protein n=1 Tax=Polynucleobacter sp. Adler-ghost TaxID=2770234 RepID=UPI001BFD71BC|nr:N-acetylneuraminate synthase family protein [Polynucleobacter sp. Adler-ghost]QWE31036.1 N-acetylneuraminate synthase family protein [Polynucleobacter sp. Adler-ghost]
MSKINSIFQCNQTPFLIAEIGLSHDGSLGFAHSMIEAISKTGFDAVKFQTHIASHESSLDEPFRINFSYQDKTRYDYWRRTEFTLEEWRGLKSHAEELGLIFLSSPFSIAAAQMLNEIGICAWKISSGEIHSRRLLEWVANTKKPIIASTGLTTFDEVNALVKFLNSKAPNRYAILQCTTEYPTLAENVGINVLDKYISMFNCPIGLSDHSGVIWPAIIAASRGARVIEVHATFSKCMFGPDTTSSLTIEQLKELKIGVDFTYKAISSDFDKNKNVNKKISIRKLFSKSVAACRNIEKGKLLKEADIVWLKPGFGISEQDYDQKYSKKKLSRDISAGEFLQEGDFE